MNATVLAERIAELLPVAQIESINENFYVPAHAALVVENKAADTRVVFEVLRQKIGNACCSDGFAGAVDMPLQVGREFNRRHGRYPLLADRMPNGVRSALRQFCSGTNAVEMNACWPDNAAWLMPSVNTIQAEPGGKRISW